MEFDMKLKSKIQKSLTTIIGLSLITLGFCKDVKSDVQPISFVPNPQNGYGNGEDQLAQPDDVEILKDGTFIVSDVDNNRVQVFDKNNILVKTIDSKTLGLENPEIIPTGIAQDGEGFIYITLEGAGTVARFNPDLTLDQFIGEKGELTAEEYFHEANENILMNPQGIIVNNDGDVFVIDMNKNVFKKGDIRNFGFRKFKKIIEDDKVKYVNDRKFTASQEVTKIMRKSEGMAISNKRNILFVAEEKPAKGQFGNSTKKRYVGLFDLETGKFLNRLIGVSMENSFIVDGNHYESIEGLSVLEDHLYVVDEKEGKVFCYDIDSGKLLWNIGKKAHYYCDDESDCVIDGVNYNEQSIIAGTAKPHLLNDLTKNELASPDGVCATELNDGTKILAVVDQWNSRILYYNLEKILKSFK